MYEDKLIVNIHVKNQVLFVRTNQTVTFRQKIEFGEWYEIQNLKDETHFSIQVVKNAEGDYTVNVEGLPESDQPKNYDIYDILNNQEITISSGEKLKYIFVEMKIQNGEYQYNSKSIHIIPEVTGFISDGKCMDVIERFADNLARDFYGNFSHADKDTYYFNGGEVAVRNYSAQEITKAEYDTLKNFM